jgi:hypothetical protein
MKKGRYMATVLAFVCTACIAPIVVRAQDTSAPPKAQEEILTPEQKAVREEAQKQAEAYAKFPAEPAFLEVHAVEQLVGHFKPGQLATIFEKFPLKKNVSAPSDLSTTFDYAGWDYRDFTGALNSIGAKAEYLGHVNKPADWQNLVKSGKAVRVLVKVADWNNRLFAHFWNDDFHHVDGSKVPWEYNHTIAVFDGNNVYDYSKLPAHVPLGSRVTPELIENHGTNMTSAIIIRAWPPAPKDDQHP